MKSIPIYLFLIMFFSASVPATELNPNSVYQFDSTWMDQNSEPTSLSAMQGEPRLIAFVYTYCEHTCPLIIAQIKSVLRALPDEDGNTIGITLITLDPVRDTPVQMKAYMGKHGLDENRWTMLAGDPMDVRVLANLFGVKYKAMRKDQLAHSNMITLLDRDGVIQYQLKGLDVDKREIVDKIAIM